MGMTDAQKIEKLQLEVFRQAVGLRLAMKAISSSKRAMKRQETLAVAIALIESMNIVEAVRQAQGARPSEIAMELADYVQVIESCGIKYDNLKAAIRKQKEAGDAA
jgi:hypothetical protein